MDKIKIVKSDITEMSVDAIVNAANNDLILGGGVAGAIRQKGGPKIQAECNTKAPIQIGEAAITTGGTLKAKYVIHAASMALGGWATADSVKSSTYNSFMRAKENNIKSIAFPAIGTGVAGFPITRCAQIMIDTAESFVKQYPLLETVYFVLYDDKAFEAFKEYYDTKSSGQTPVQAK
ncbi:MAG: macro domain-containing protein [Planctomycetes bacterium]|nr:macro domain-containing protein [Planctomycetota bacterium]